MGVALKAQRLGKFRGSPHVFLLSKQADEAPSSTEALFPTTGDGAWRLVVKDRTGMLRGAVALLSDGHGDLCIVCV